MAKKQFSLNYEIERDTERLAEVERILDGLERSPSPSDLELMASYILYGKDENGQNAVQRKECTDTNKRYGSYLRSDDKNESLEEVLANPMTNEQSFREMSDRRIYLKRKPVIKRPKYDKEGNLLDIGDADIPGMVELWDAIDRVQRILDVANGKVPPDENTPVAHHSYRLYQLEHALIDMRRHQFYLKDSYKPTIHFLNVPSPSPQLVNFDSDAAYHMTEEQWRDRIENSYHPYDPDLSHYERYENGDIRWVVRHQNFDWENPKHVRHLIEHYSELLMQTWDKPDSWGRSLIFDFDRYFNMAGFSPLREYALTRRIDGAKNETVAREIEEKFNISYKPNHIGSIVCREIPNRIATTARAHRLMLETPENEKKKCFRCGRLLPRDPIFYVRNRGRKDGFNSICKECDKKRRAVNGGKTTHDTRNKEEKADLLKMQAGEG